MRLITGMLILALGLAGPAIGQEKYVTAVDATFAPHAMPTLDGGLEGFNIDLGHALAEQLGAEIEIVGTQFSGILPGLQAGTYDFVLAPTTVTPERAKNYLFSEGYLNTDFRFLVLPGHEKVTDLEQFAGETISVNKGSAYDSWARGLAPEIGWTVESYGTAIDAVAAVLSGRADATVAGNTVMAYAVKQNPRLELSYLHSTGLVWSLVFRQGDEELRAKFDRAIECLKANGAIAELSEKWFGVTPPEGSVPATPTPGYGVPGTPGYVEDEHPIDCE